MFSPPCTCLMPHSEWTPCDINVTYTSLKSAFSGLQFRRWQYGSIFIRLAVIASETREMSRNSKRIWPYRSSRSSKVIDLGVNGKPICDFLLVINLTLAVSATVFEIFTLKDRKLLILPTFPGLTLPLGVTISNFVMKFGIRKLESWGYQIVKKSWRLIQYRRVTERRTDRHVALANNPC